MIPSFWIKLSTTIDKEVIKRDGLTLLTSLINFISVLQSKINIKQKAEKHWRISF